MLPSEASPSFPGPSGRTFLSEGRLSGSGGSAKVVKQTDRVFGMGKIIEIAYVDGKSEFVKKSNGKPYDTAWGGTCLDMTNPEARNYLRGIVKRIAHEWGYRVFKLDGFWTGKATKQVYVNDGYVNDGIGDAVFANPDKTNLEALRDG